MCEEHVIFTHCMRCWQRADPFPRACLAVVQAGKGIGYCGAVYMTGERVYSGLCLECQATQIAIDPREALATEYRACRQRQRQRRQMEQQRQRGRGR